ncbi:uncharacterized protein N7469_000612 [Penicillium citrinum]|uniref:SAGA-associated factor 11 n=1 Tax=Penicillium citrinum TaxID=5077 RepID=A0A9W9PCZ0_PENCI|nr:uncharacterized protein N7469_000612 [Penicillium citrinum]KAJ5242285.1 hypothetical protein N7469_000612 [Penicillium citrinum]KAK5807045.1 hypothetical protein VI817_001303 [Penicillium citrinum]
MTDSNAVAQRPSYPAGTIAKVSTDILNETFHNIIHDLVAKVHREEKVARMRSAVVVARQRAEEEATVPEETASKSVTDQTREVVIDAHKLANTRLETDAAIFDHGKVHLKGNPLHTVKEIICPDCRLPRLSYPPVGAGHRPPPDPNKKYCKNGPMITLPGHDVHGKLFAIMPNPKKRKDQKDSTIPEIPTSKCPICPRYFVMNRVAQHLDRCMNISGRNSTRNKTPTDSGNSGASSPTSSAPKRPHDNDDEGSPSPTKKKKLSGSNKKGSTNKPGPSKLKNSFTAEENDDDIKSENADG